MTRFVRGCAWALAAAVLLASAAPIAQAGIGEDVMFFEVYAGLYDPELSALDSTTTFGVRLGGTIGTRLAISGTLGYFEADGRVSGSLVSGPIEVLAGLADATMSYLFIPDSRFVTIAAGGGIGGAFAEVDGELTTNELELTFKNFGENSFTLHLTGAAAFNLSKRLYLKPAVRWRWYEARDDNNFDLEYTFALGYIF